MAGLAGRTGIGVAVVLSLVLNAAVVAARTGDEGKTRLASGSARSASLGSEALTDDEAPTAATTPTTPGFGSRPGPRIPAPTTTAPRPSSTTTSTTRPPKTTSTTAPSVAGIEGPGLHVVAPDGTGLLRLTSHNGGLFTWSPDGTRLAHSTQDELIIVRADGSGRSTLATARGALAPVWSPDGSRLAFNLPERGVFVARADGSGAATLIDPDGYFANWTVDNRLAVLTHGFVGVHPTVVLYDLAGGRQVLTTAAGKSVDPAPSPDGRLVAYVTDRLMVAAVDGSGSRPLTGVCCNSDIFPWAQRWSPDSGTLAYSQMGDIWVVGVAGGNQRLFAEKSDSPAWSPDGRSLAVIGNQTNRDDGYTHTKLQVLPAQGGVARTIYDPGQVLTVQHPQWSSNGRQLAVMVTHSGLPGL